jgi:hypothetical protein
MTVGTRAQVMRGTRDTTSGGLKKSDLKYNQDGRIVSKVKSSSAKRTAPPQLKHWRDAVSEVHQQPKYNGKFVPLKKGTQIYKDVKKVYKENLEQAGLA